MVGLLAGMLWPGGAAAQERPYFVTYTHHLEEPGALEISVNPVVGAPRKAAGFVGSWVEVEYGVKGWWTTEVYLDWQTTRRDSTVFTGYRWENRFRPLRREHWINPVLYVEFANVNEADKTFREVVGFFDEGEASEPNSELRREKEREIELKLILSSNFRGWNISENFITEKNVAGGPWKFGYGVGMSRPLALAASAQDCTFCRENFTTGFEVFGGLGNDRKFTGRGASHYLAPVVAWSLPNGTTLRLSPAFGLTSKSHRVLVRFGVSYEIAGFGRKVRNLFR